MKIRIAIEKDNKDIQDFFNHYGNKKIIMNRVNCYLTHNSTIIAENHKEIIGVVQWYLKENPNAGVAELEEMFILEKYRGQGIGERLLNFAITNIKDFFNKT